MIYSDTSLLLPIHVPEVNTMATLDGRLSDAARAFGVQVVPAL